MNLEAGVSRKQSKPNFARNEHFLPPDTHTYVCVSGGKKCSFFGKIGVLCFLKTPVLRFALLLYYRQNTNRFDLPDGPNNFPLSPFHDTSDFLMFSGSIERDQWLEMSWKLAQYCWQHSECVIFFTAKNIPFCSSWMFAVAITS